MECNVCYTKMEYNIKSPKCKDKHAICTACFFLSNSHKCSYCRRLLSIIEIRKNTQTVCVTNYITKEMLLYYALIHVHDTMKISWLDALKFLDPHKEYKEISTIFYKEIYLGYLLMFLLHIGTIFSFYQLNNLSVYGIYCDRYNCYMANYYHVYLMIKCILISNIIILWVYFLYQKQCKSEIKTIMFKRLMKNEF